MYNEQEEKFETAGPIDSNGVVLDAKYKDYTFEDVPREQVQEVFASIASKYSEIANDVLTNDVTEVPTTNTDEKDIEK